MKRKNTRRSKLAGWLHAMRKTPQLTFHPYLHLCFHPYLAGRIRLRERTALAHYNMVHRTHYALVEPLRSGRGVGSWVEIHSCVAVAFHCNFTAAKLRKNNSPSRPKLFYASFVCSESTTNHIHCCIVDPADALHNNCVICPPDLAHCPCNLQRETIMSAEGNPNRKEIDGNLVRNECRRVWKEALAEDRKIALWNRLCLHEEEEYQNIKAKWLDACRESPAKEVHKSHTFINFPSPFSSPRSSSSRQKDKVEEKVSYGQICESLWNIGKFPESLL